jgi:hypothetical protein
MPQGQHLGAVIVRAAVPEALALSFPPMSTFKPPLTTTELQAIQERNQRVPGDPVSDDLYAALWEIRRLRAIVLRAGQLQRALGVVTGGSAGMILEALRRELAAEPCVLEQAQLPELSGQPRR